MINMILQIYLRENSGILSKRLLIAYLTTLATIACAQTMDTVGLEIVVPRKISLPQILFGFTNQEDSIYKHLFSKMDTLSKMEASFQKEINMLQSKEVRDQIVYDYAFRYDGSIQSRLSFLSKYIKVKGILPIPTLNAPEGARVSAIGNRSFLVDYLTTFYHSDQLNDCRFFDHDSYENEHFLSTLAMSSKGLYRFVYDKIEKANGCRKANLQRIIEEMNRLGILD